MNKKITSNEELFEAIRALQHSLLASGNDHAAREIANGFSCLNGLTDGWARLMEALEKANKIYGSAFNDGQEKDLEDILSCVKEVVYRE